MGIIEILFIGIGLSMDAFAASVCKGLSIKKINLKEILVIGLYFGIFQALMPIIGFLLGNSLGNLIVQIDHWVAFGLLIFIGIGMISEIFEENDECDDKIDFKSMIMISIATSIDALAVGITFAFLNVKIIPSSILIGFTTFIISAIGVKIGNIYGDKYEKKAKLIGGLILIIIGIKILLEHLICS